MLNLYQMCDPEFMKNLKECQGQVFTRRINDDKSMIVGIIKNKNFDDETLYPALITLDTSKKEKIDAKGDSLSGVLKKCIWKI